MRLGATGAHPEKNERKPWLPKHWVIPPEAIGEFVWRMEDVLEAYSRAARSLEG
jgi:hypothetical protein